MPKLALALIVALGILNILLLMQNLSLRRQLNSVGKTEATANALNPGELVTPITGTDLNGQPYQVQYANDGRKQLLIFFLSQLPLLRRAGSNLARRAQPDRFQPL